MKTVTYQNILYRAAEMAKRTRDDIQNEEALMFQMFLGGELQKYWEESDWPELCDNLASYAVTNTNGILTVSKNEGQPGEIGDVLGVYWWDPRLFSHAREIDWHEGNGQIYLVLPNGWGNPPANTSAQNVFIDWQLPSPDLTTITNTATLAATTIPARFYLPLAMAGAAWMLKQDGEDQSAAVLEALAQQEIDRQAAKVERPWWRSRARVLK